LVSDDLVGHSFFWHILQKKHKFLDTFSYKKAAKKVGLQVADGMR